MIRNNDPFAPWNGPERSNPFAPWNDPMYRSDPFAPWNEPLSDERRYEEYCEDHNIDYDKSRFDW